MAAEDGDKTEAPTPRRREEARRKGQIARSQDLGSALLLLGAMICLRWFGPGLLQILVGLLQRQLVIDNPHDNARFDVAATVATIGLATLSAAGPVMAAVMVVATASHLLQVGFLFSSEAMQFKLAKLNPVSGFKRIFSTRSLVQFAMNLGKLVVVAVAGWLAIRGRLGEVLLAVDTGGWEQVALMATILYEVGLILAAVLVVLALVDFAWQRWRHEQDLKMTREEVKEELRRMEGDPIIKQRRRRMQMTAALQHIRKNVPTADVVVTNPTELAIAIQYNNKQMSAPKVVAKGQDFLAAKIREIAIEHGVPIVERKPLAQALFKSVDVGQEIPEQFYKAVAEILAYVYELSGAARRMRGATAA